MSIRVRPTRLNHLFVDVAIAGAARGDLLFRGASKWNNLAAGTAGRLLRTGGAGADPSWFDLFGTANTWTASQTVVASADAVTPASVRQFSGTQSANLLAFTSSDGATLLSAVDAAGNFVVPIGSATVPGLRFVGNLTTGIGLAAGEIQIVIAGANVAKVGSGRALFVGSVACPAGAVGTPGLYLGPDTTTGLYRAGGNIVGVTVSGTQRAQIDSTGLGVVGQVGITLTDAVTNAVSAVNTQRHNSSGTAAAGFGAGTLYQLQSSTTASQDAAQIAAAWAVATHASRTSEIRLSTVQAAGALAEVARFDKGGGASPSAGNTGFMLWDVDNNTLERVTVGAADSGGTGFKVLRIPN